MESPSTKGTVQAEDELYRRLPSVNDVLQAPGMKTLGESCGHKRVADVIRTELADLRNRITSKHISSEELDVEVGALPERIAETLERGPDYSLRPLINGTGVILHTNLGRAPLSEAALAHVVEVARGYSNLEFDLGTGERSRRDTHAERLVFRVLDVAEDEFARYGVIIVNNCAAATFLALNTLADKREVVVSRGELVEIGGGFRIPEILEKSGAVLREVGTTNRTRVADYEQVVSEQTALLLRVHQSNFSMEGFVERPTLQALVSLAKTLGVPLFEDQGTGLLCELEQIGIANQPTLRGSIAAGVDLVAASGDKLLGGPQCGLLIGRADLIARIRKNPLLRTFRVDKLTYAALEATLFDYLTGALESIPLMRILHASVESIEQRCRSLASSVHSVRLNTAVVPVESVVGGGTAPSARIKSFALSLNHVDFGADKVLKKLRQSDPPVIARIAEDQVLLDLRTVPPQSDEIIVRVLNEL
ncbi:MAG TPA: L-seryl-tRNA(Sec) selenium transferase [Terracidiphilus sp.]|jgi:L-seryl-tRNA(Ser) seleniumtransferase